MRRTNRVAGLVVAVISLLSLLPVAVVLISSFNSGSAVTFPPSGLSVRWYQSFFDSPELRASLWNSIDIAAAAATVSLVLGAAASIAIVRFPFRGFRAVEGLLLAPIISPPLVIGIGILELYIWLHLGASFYTLLLGHLVLTTPFTMRLAMTSLAGGGRQLEQAAASLGATSLTVFWKITMRTMRPGLIAGFVVAIIVSFDDLAMTSFLTSPGYRTLPVELYSAIQQQATPIVYAGSAILLIVSTVLLLVLDRIVRLERLVTATAGM